MILKTAQAVRPEVRPLRFVPKPVLLILALAFSAQLLWHVQQPVPLARAEALPAPPGLASIQLASFGEPIGLSKLLLLYIQTFDNQPGVQGSFRLLDYRQIQVWLNLALQLDPRGQYPLFLASQIYGAVGEPTKQATMFDFVYHQFFADPDRRWNSLAYAAIMTRHQLNDLPLAEKYAAALRLYATDKSVPDWAQQMDIFMLADMGETDKALTLLDKLLASGQVTDAAELQFLRARRVEMERLRPSSMQY